MLMVSMIPMGWTSIHSKPKLSVTYFLICCYIIKISPFCERFHHHHHHDAHIYSSHAHTHIYIWLFIHNIYTLINYIFIHSLHEFKQFSGDVSSERNRAVSDRPRQVWGNNWGDLPEGPGASPPWIFRKMVLKNGERATPFSTHYYGT
jgi:hypothetical protein